MAKPYFSRILPFKMLLNSKLSLINKMSLPVLRRQTQQRLWGDRIFEKCGIGRDERGDGGKTLEIRGKRRLPARDRGANYQQS